MKEYVPLAPFTTLRLGGPARYFAECTTTEEIKETLRFAREKKLPVFVLGGGSNVLVSDDGFPGVVLQVSLRGKNIVSENEEIIIDVAAGETLDDIIAWTVSRGWWGMENLSFIPGRVGALVIQNVNAYGVKAEHIVQSVEVLDREEFTIKEFTNKECLFRYRGSIFNKEYKDRYVVLSVRIGLRRKGEPVTGYVDILKHLSHKNIGRATLPEMREMIIHIRKGKGFDPEKIWSAGSFFSNLMISEQESEELRQRIHDHSGEDLARKYDDIVRKFFEAGEVDPHLEKGKIKIPTGFLLDQVLNLKGTTHGSARVSPMHAQTIYNTGSATAREVLEFSQHIQKKAWEVLGVRLVHEPELVGFSPQDLG